MDGQKSTAVVRTPGRNPGDTPRSGVIHVNVRHTRRFTVVGNHLARHPEMSLVAIGLAVHIQSLPTGARIGILGLAPRFPESEYRTAAALRELELHGYLERTRVRLTGGQAVTRTVSYDRPGCLAEATEAGTAPPAPPVTPPGHALLPRPGNPGPGRSRGPTRRPPGPSPPLPLRTGYGFAPGTTKGSLPDAEASGREPLCQTWCPLSRATRSDREITS
ncbi:hypothetical protein ACQEVM_04510 [Streptomyces sp. CA-243310]|uniref:hypothetical protein n=1 Tax=Streptomyces sp. CA-243310 TaxID=3240056 RepID=UPI003D91AEDB